MDDIEFVVTIGKSEDVANLGVFAVEIMICTILVDMDAYAGIIEWNKRCVVRSSTFVCSRAFGAMDISDNGLEFSCKDMIAVNVDNGDGPVAIHASCLEARRRAFSSSSVIMR